MGKAFGVDVWRWVGRDCGREPLWVAGESPDRRRWVGVVGSRAVDDYGLQVAQRVAAAAVTLGFGVVSGGAEGCDTAAHRGAMDAGGTTMVVLAGGHGHTYPACNRPLFGEVVRGGGAVVSTYSPEHRPRRHQFVARNAVIASWSEVLVVVRAKAGSGSLHTARFALKQGRPVLVVPSALGDGLGSGCMSLLDEGAGVLTGPRALARSVGQQWSGRPWPVSFQGLSGPWREDAVAPPMALGHAAMEVLGVITGDSALDLESVVMRTGLPVGAVSGALLDLEAAGRVRRLGGDRFIAAR